MCLRGSEILVLKGDDDLYLKGIEVSNQSGCWHILLYWLLYYPLPPTPSLLILFLPTAALVLRVAAFIMVTFFCVIVMIHY